MFDVIIYIISSHESKNGIYNSNNTIKTTANANTAVNTITATTNTTTSTTTTCTTTCTTACTTTTKPQLQLHHHNNNNTTTATTTTPKTTTTTNTTTTTTTCTTTTKPQLQLHQPQLQQQHPQLQQLQQLISFYWPDLIRLAALLNGNAASKTTRMQTNDLQSSDLETKFIFQTNLIEKKLKYFFFLQKNFFVSIFAVLACRRTAGEWLSSPISRPFIILHIHFFHKLFLQCERKGERRWWK